ncbi:MAG: YceI family protein [Gemmatimonadaceae bacterium]
MRLLRVLALAAAGTFTAAPAIAQQPAAAQAMPSPAGSVAPTPAATTLTTYEIDPVHSELSFRIRHLLGRVAGTFGEWGGTVVIDTVTPANSRVDVDIRSASIDTRVAARDEHLRSADFFAADSFPAITFRSTNVSVSGNQVRVRGDLTIRGRTKPVLLSGTYEGQFEDPWGEMRTAFLASTTIDRQDFGVSFNAPFEQIGQIGDEVWIEIAIEAVRKQAVQR